MKNCKRCNIVKSFSEFKINKNNKDGYDSYCMPCRKEYNKEYHAKTYTRKHVKEKIVDGKRHCAICKEYKDFSEFHEGNQSWCKPCKTEYSRKKNEKTAKWPRKYLDGKMHCRECDQYFDLDNFTKLKGNSSRCDSCATIHQHRKTLKKHNMTYEQYLKLYEAQNQSCKLCKKPDTSFRTRLSVDHDHNCCPRENSCGKCIRGLLCHHCNAALGNVKDDVELLQKMIDYLNSGYLEIN